MTDLSAAARNINWLVENCAGERRSPRRTGGSLSFERGQILALVTALPLGVARVLVGDLVDEGFLTLDTRSATGRPDFRLLERVLDGLQAL